MFAKFAPTFLDRHHPRLQKRHLSPRASNHAFDTPSQKLPSHSIIDSQPAELLNVKPDLSPCHMRRATFHIAQRKRETVTKPCEYIRRESDKISFPKKEKNNTFLCPIERRCYQTLKQNIFCLKFFSVGLFQLNIKYLIPGC